MQPLTENILPDPSGSPLSLESWNEVIKLMVSEYPVIGIFDSENEMTSKILHSSPKRKESNSLIIDIPQPDYSARAVDNRQRLLFTGQYFRAGLHYTVSSHAILERYLIFNRYPALVLTIIPPIKQISKLLIVYPTEDRQVFLEIPIDGSSPSIQVSQMNSKNIIIKSPEMTHLFPETRYINGVRLQLIDLGKTVINGEISRINNEELSLDLKQIDSNSERIINNYLNEEFKQKQEEKHNKLIKHTITPDADNQTIHEEDKTGKNKNNPEETPGILPKAHILIIDDEPENHTHIKILFNEYDYHVHFATNGIKGIQMTNYLKPDIILLDIEMPGMSGIQVLTSLRKFPQTKSIPVIMLTGRSEIEIIKNAVNFNISGYVTKPYDALDLYKRIKKTLEQV
jgi:CheY-like chemotaxis protein